MWNKIISLIIGITVGIGLVFGYQKIFLDNTDTEKEFLKLVEQSSTGSVKDDNITRPKTNSGSSNIENNGE